MGGAGEFEMVTVPTNIKPGYFYCVVAFALVAVVIYLLNPMAPTTTTTAPDIVIPTTSAPDITTTSEPYCCKSKGLWFLDKKAWCCKHYGVGACGGYDETNVLSYVGTGATDTTPTDDLLAIR